MTEINQQTVEANTEVAASQEKADNGQQAESLFAKLFGEEETVSVSNAGNQLDKTRDLTILAQKHANDAWKIINSNPADYEDQFKAAVKSHDQMDDLLAEVVDLESIDIDFLKGTSEDELEKMIRSQQSKRSRAKAKPVSQETVLTMMTGAIAENLLRRAANKPKGQGGGFTAGEINYTEAQIEEFKTNADKLKKEIRNVQSKKSIMKSKADFDEQSPRYQELLQAEEILKTIRDGSTPTITKEAEDAIAIKSELEETVEELDVDSLSEEDAKLLLSKVKEILISKSEGAQ